MNAAVMIIGLFLHILAAVIWVGGMFFAHQMLRPAAGKLDPAQRLPLWRRVFQRFFPWVWACVATLLLTGYGMVISGFGGFAHIGLHVHVMQAIGIVMMLAFAHLYFAPWARFRRAVDASDFPAAQGRADPDRRALGCGGPHHQGWNDA